jgi:peptidoglycan/xylan/chitin deacetylase (PgdA/CDA1 family)
VKRLLANTIAALTSTTGIDAAINSARWHRGAYRVLVLEYHDVRSGPDSGFGALDVQVFRSQMTYLAERYRCVSLAEAVRILTGRAPLCQDVVCVTFDDGYLGNYKDAWPILKRLGIPMTIFVTTGFLDGEPLWFDCMRALFERAKREPEAAREIESRLRGAGCSVATQTDAETALSALKRLPHLDRTAVVADLWRAFGDSLQTPRPLAWEQVRELLDDGVEIGAHTVTHPILSSLEAAMQRAEIEMARDRIGEMTGVVPRYFAYPNGSADDFTASTQRAVAEAGFEAALSTLRGANHPGATDLFAVRRIGIGPDSTRLLQARLTGLFDAGVRRLVGVS